MFRKSTIDKLNSLQKEDLRRNAFGNRKPAYSRRCGLSSRFFWL